MDRVIVAIIGIPVAFIIMVYRAKLKEFTGEIAFAEKYLGVGGTYNLFILIGMVVFIFSVMYMFGSFQEISAATLGRFFIS